MAAEARLRKAAERARAADAKHKAARAALRDEIRAAREAGMTLDAIAEIVGVSRQRILQLLKDTSN